ncbi:15147_t:CDS:2 [Cetraspora pellucida]|uniref:15147_t:CDS:1 n=1 Tax=Cetraspora pellucida TaxID=1433469 RepID=A0ACA9L0W4_9GLOM|nr:15147_t:CDS:2 [Cetraspora pellucida]
MSENIQENYNYAEIDMVFESKYPTIAYRTPRKIHFIAVKIWKLNRYYQIIRNKKVSVWKVFVAIRLLEMKRFNGELMFF